jgi:hypothetical protein
VRSTSAIAVLSINFSRALVLGRVYRPVRADRGARAINCRSRRRCIRFFGSASTCT